ncbi:hypothetical protein Lnau_1311 [Legionella nautarum]|uniref:Uncharacterized protein n=1 Tax=Legionella nautarum TaxID=45070 RepID=A0A0W0WVI6_9GAMM|nr:hypothetical protein Lnau_1311 [Legionella nautarum]
MGLGEYDFTQDIEESRVCCSISAKYWHLKALSYLIASLGWICSKPLNLKNHHLFNFNSPKRMVYTIYHLRTEFIEFMGVFYGYEFERNSRKV